MDAMIVSLVRDSILLDSVELCSLYDCKSFLQRLNPLARARPLNNIQHGQVFQEYISLLYHLETVQLLQKNDYKLPPFDSERTNDLEISYPKSLQTIRIPLRYMFNTSNKTLTTKTKEVDIDAYQVIYYLTLQSLYQQLATSRHLAGHFGWYSPQPIILLIDKRLYNFHLSS